MHGGTNPGPPRGNTNALKHGYWSADAVAVRKLTRDLRQQLREIK